MTVYTDYKLLLTFRTKIEQLAYIVRFLDAIKHYAIRIVYRISKSNVLAD